jgi:hypothetical protein
MLHDSLERKMIHLNLLVALPLPPLVCSRAKHKPQKECVSAISSDAAWGVRSEHMAHQGRLTWEARSLQLLASAGAL